MLTQLAQHERAVHRTDSLAKRRCLTAGSVDELDRGYCGPQGSPILGARESSLSGFRRGRPGHTTSPTLGRQGARISKAVSFRNRMEMTERFPLARPRPGQILPMRGTFSSSVALQFFNSGPGIHSLSRAGTGGW
jgi:hypothetical protein